MRVLERSFFRAGAAGSGDHNTGQLNIAVTGLGRGVGTTLVASSLACFFAEKGNSVTFVQCDDPEEGSGLLFDAAAMDRRFYGREFQDAYGTLASGGGVRRLCNLEDGVNWLLITPDDVKAGIELSAEQRASLVYGPRDEVCIFDLCCREDWAGFLRDMDRIIAVVDPLPSRMAAATERFRMLRALENSRESGFSWLVSGVNSGVSRRQVRGYLKSSNIMWVGRAGADSIYADEFRCRFHWENEEIRRIFEDTFTKVSQ